MHFHHHHHGIHHVHGFHHHGFHRFHGFRHRATKGSAIVMLLVLAAALYFLFAMHGMERLSSGVVPTHHSVWTPSR